MSTIDDEYKRVVTLVNSLDKGEMKTLERYLEFSQEGKALKSVALLKLIKSKRQYKAATVLSKLDCNDKAFKALMGSLRDKLTFSLTLDVSLNRINKWSNRSKNEYLCQNRITEAKILVSKRQFGEARKLFLRVLSLADKYELHEIGASAATELADYGYARVSMEEGDIYATLADSYLKKNQQRLRARRAFYNGQYLVMFKAGLGNYLDRLEEEFREMELLYEETRLAEVGYYFFYLGIILDGEKQNFAGVEQKCGQLLKLLKESPAIAMPRRIGATYIRRSKIQILQGNFEGGRSGGERATTYFSRNKGNLGESYVVQCYASLYLGDSVKAKTAINRALGLTSAKKEPLWYAERTYLKACAYFLEGDHYRSHLSLQKETKHLDKDKQGFKVAISILFIMNQIVWKRAMADADAYIEKLWAYVRRYRDQFTLSARFLICIEMLKSLTKNGYDFGMVQQLHAEDLEKLKSNLPGYKWVPLTAEVVRFDLWFESMSTQSPYKLVV